MANSSLDVVPLILYEGNEKLKRMYKANESESLL